MQFSGNSALFLGSFIAYIALMILIGWFASRKVSKGGTAFLTGGGHLPVFLTVCTAAATLIGTGGTMVWAAPAKRFPAASPVSVTSLSAPSLF